jgi:hypothetical protein
MVLQQISVEDVASVLAPWVWDLGNHVLYNLCRNHPRHTEEECIIAKIWLIGRSYAASIERRRGAAGSGDKFYEQTVAPRIKASAIDGWINESRGGDPGTPATIAAHKHLTDLFRSFTGLQKRSLASKYLHFHVPDAFFIYDSRARAAVTKLVPRLNKLPDVDADRFDPEFKDFVRRCIWLRDHVREGHGVELDPRQIDKLLLLLHARSTVGTPGQ